MPRPNVLLPLIVLAQFAGTSLWFAGNAVLAGLPGISVAWLTVAVQLGFIGGTLLFALFTLADRVPASKLFFICTLLGAGANALIPFFLQQSSSLFVLRVATGFFLAGIYPIGMKIATDWYPQGLGKVLGWLVGALVLGTAFPHLLKGSLAQLSPAPILWSISLIAASGGLLLLIFIPSIQSKKLSSGFQIKALRLIWKEKAFRSAAIGYLGHMWELYTFWAFVPLLLQAHHRNTAISPAELARESFAVIAVGALGCIAGGNLATKLGSARISIGALFLSGACCILLPLALLGTATFFLLFLLVWGCSVVADSPQLSALAAQTAPPHLKGTALTALTCAGFALTIVSLLAIQYLSGHLGQPAWTLVLLAAGPAAGIRALRSGDCL